jgi:hypothetical protein
MSRGICDISIKQPMCWREEGPERETGAGDKRDISAIARYIYILQCINPVVVAHALDKDLTHDKGHKI